MWLRSRPPNAARRHEAEQKRGLVQKAVQGLHAAVESIQSCVQQHSDSLTAINDSLSEGDASDAAASIIEANQLAEHQFQTLQGDLATHASQVRGQAGPGGVLRLATLVLDRQQHAYLRVLNSLEELANEVSSELDGCGEKLRHVSAGLESTENNSSTEVRHAICEVLDAVDELGQSADAAEVKLEQSAQKVCMQAILSHADLLTALPNRRALEELLASAAASNGQRPSPCSLILVDLEDFTEVNNKHGYPGGDAVLRQAAILLKRLSQGQATTARFGGDCFALLMPGVTLAKAMPVAERVRDEVASSRFCEGRKPVTLTASVGVVQLQQGESPNQAIVRATMALKESDQAEDNTAYYNDGRQCFPISQAHRKKTEEARNVDAPEYPTAASLGVDAPEAPAAQLPEGESDGMLCGRSIFIANVRRRLAEWNRGGPIVSVLLMRVDQVDDLTGRRPPQAFEFLRRVLSRLLQAATRDMDQRCDYEQGVFAVMLPGADERTALMIADRLRSQVANCKLRLDSELWDLTASIGVADATAGATVVDVLMAAAAGMEMALRDGGDTAVAFSDLTAETPTEW